MQILIISMKQKDLFFFLTEDYLPLIEWDGLPVQPQSNNLSKLISFLLVVFALA